MHSDTLRGIALIITAMAFFASTDTFIKLAAETLPTGQVLLLLGGGGTLIFAALTRLQGHAVLARDFFDRPVILRNISEIIGTFCFVTALSTVGISTASAILQATPLAVTLGAVVLLNEQVGWRRWSAILVGFAGVLVIIRPGLDAFDPNALWAVGGMLALGFRDLVTRMVNPAMPSRRIATYGMAMLVFAGTGLLALDTGPVAMGRAAMTFMALAVILGALGYYCIIAAMRIGEISVVAPFRYSRIFFALGYGYLVFHERPDAMTYLGAAITIAAGLYTFVRETRAARRLTRARLSTPHQQR